MPDHPDLYGLPPAAIARLRALNPELQAEFEAPAAQEHSDMQALQAQMYAAQDRALSALQALVAIRQAPPEPVKEKQGGLVFSISAAVIAGIYIFIKAGAL